MSKAPDQTMTQRIEDHNQAEYVRGIQAGRRIERQHKAARTAAHTAMIMCFGVVLGLLIGLGL